MSTHSLRRPILPQVRAALPKTQADRDAETEHAIVDLMEQGLAMHKPCSTEQQRVEYLTGLAYVAPARDSGWYTRIAKRLKVHWGTHKKADGETRGRPHAYDVAVDRRAEANKIHSKRDEPLREGEQVLSHCEPCELTRICGDFGTCDKCGPPCVITVRGEGAEEDHSYSSMFGNKPGSARLQRPPLSFAPPPRETRKDDKHGLIPRARVKAFAYEALQTSPCKRDAMRKQIKPRLWATKQALILLGTKEALFAKFDERYPGYLSERGFNEILALEVWNLKRAYRETCLCRTCFNCRLYREGLAVVAKILALLLKPSPAADADEGDVSSSEDEDESTAQLQRLHDFCASHQSGCRRATADLVCASSLDQAKSDCLKGKCSKCGLVALWKPIRKTLVYDAPAGKLKPDVSRVWLTMIKWDRIKTGGDGSNSEDDLRQHCEGTLIQFLDQAAQAYTHFLPHSFHIDQAKAASREFDHNSPPGIIHDDSDWSENGECKVKHQLQSEYWTIIYYSMLISISAFLVTSVWEEKSSSLAKGDEVTVEAERADGAYGSMEPAEGSFFAVVDAASKEGNMAMVSVRTPLGVVHTVPRYRLRHRIWHRTAFIQLTNDKKHDGWSSQAFHSRRLEYFKILHERGHAAAREFALNDRAEAARVEAETAEPEGYRSLQHRGGCTGWVVRLATWDELGSSQGLL
mmetsp:Transcript_47642/g.125862  ORF Transcript_47642/g.125862 Transcript_47642/m.125862 type:complete len:691 (-) Transcript_47642:17-2089(-)